MNLTRELATVHDEFGAARDRRYEAVARCDFAGAGKVCEELRGIFKRYATIRARAAREAGAEFSKKTWLANCKSRAHLSAAAASGDTDKLDELLAREAIQALSGERERDE